MSAVPAMIRVFAVLLFSLALRPAIAVTPSDAAPAPGKEYVMGVFPHLPPRDLEDVFGPMAKDFGEHLGHPVVLASSTTFERFSESLDSQKFDIAFVQPFDYIRIAEKYGYLPLATRTERLNGIIVTPKDGPLKSVSGLKGKHIALPPSSAAVSQLILLHLRERGLQPDKDLTVTYHRSHVSCMQQVVIGEADACGTAAPSLRFFQNKMQVDLKVIASTRDIPSSLFVIHPRVPKKERERLRNRIISWSNTDEGKTILARGELTPFMHVDDNDYDVVRRLSKK
jgi:phosphonate transport system substrate-binding protein